MNIAYYHASKFGNGAIVAQEFRKVMAARDVVVSIQHIRDASPKRLAAADLYVFSSPGRIGKPKGNARRFLPKVRLAPDTRYAILTTQVAPRPLEEGWQDKVTAFADEIESTLRAQPA